MKKTLLTALLLSFQIPLFAHAGNEEAVAAHRQGDYVAAFTHWQTLAQRGDAEAQYTLGLMYDLGEETAKDPVQALLWLRKAAEQNFAAAQYAIGAKYLHGNGVPPNEQEAIKWFTRLLPSHAAEALASPYAQLVIYELGGKYAATPEAARDYSVTFPWFRALALQGNPYAQFYLGIMYERGLGTPENRETAAEWFRKASENGVAGAMEKLAESYQQGKGVIANPVAAYALFELAAAATAASPQERERALDKRRSLATGMSASEISQAEKLKMAMMQPGNFANALQSCPQPLQ